MNKPRVLLDCDGVLSDFISPCLDIVARLTGKRYTHSDVTEWDFEKTFIPAGDGRQRFWDEVTAPGFCASLKPYEGAVAGVRRLQEVADVYVVTSPMATGRTWMYERTEWLREHFGIERKRVVHTPAKYLIAGDFLLDDKPEHIIEWQEHHPSGCGLLWAQPYNKRSMLDRVHAWSEVIARVRGVL